MTQDHKPTDNLEDDQVDIAATAGIFRAADGSVAGTYANSSAGGASSSASSSSSSSAPLQFELEAEIERLKDELQSAKEQGLRALADAQNIRRRAEQDIEKAHKFGLEKFVAELLPVADNLERSIEAFNTNNGDAAVLIEGVELTLKTLLGSFGKQQVVALDPAGEPFDPQLHQAMTAVPNPDVEPNTVLNVFQKGYTLHGRLVRPAMVVVSKTPE